MNRLLLRHFSVLVLPLVLALGLAWHEEVRSVFAPREGGAGVLPPTTRLGELKTNERLAFPSPSEALVQLEARRLLHHTASVEPLVAAWAKREPAAAARWLASRPACMTFANIRAVAISWLEHSEGAAIDWVESHLDEKQRRSLLVELLVVVRDDASVSRLLSIVDPRAVDEAIAEHCTTRVSDPACGRLLARLIADEDLRRRTLGSLSAGDASADVTRLIAEDEPFAPLLSQAEAE